MTMLSDIIINFTSLTFSLLGMSGILLITYTPFVDFTSSYYGYAYVSLVGLWIGLCIMVGRTLFVTTKTVTTSVWQWVFWKDQMNPLNWGVKTWSTIAAGVAATAYWKWPEIEEKLKKKRKPDAKTFQEVYWPDDAADIYKDFLIDGAKIAAFYAFVNGDFQLAGQMRSGSNIVSDYYKLFFGSTDWQTQADKRYTIWNNGTTSFIEKCKATFGTYADFWKNNWKFQIKTIVVAIWSAWMIKRRFFPKRKHQRSLETPHDNPAPYPKRKPRVKKGVPGKPQMAHAGSVQMNGVDRAMNASFIGYGMTSNEAIGFSAVKIGNYIVTAKHCVVWDDLHQEHGIDVKVGDYVIWCPVVKTYDFPELVDGISVCDIEDPELLAFKSAPSAECPRGANHCYTIGRSHGSESKAMSSGPFTYDGDIAHHWCTTYPGSSGGGVFNTQGVVVGIHNIGNEVEGNVFMPFNSEMVGFLKAGKPALSKSSASQKPLTPLVNGGETPMPDGNLTN